MPSRDHAPRGNPCTYCGQRADYHRPSHAPKQWPVCTCGAPASNHRVNHIFKPGSDDNCICGLAETNHHGRGRRHGQRYKIDFVGIDGEGIGRDPHKYVLLCAASNTGQRWSLEDKDGLRTKDILPWLLSTLDKCRIFSYGFGYDTTMLLRDLPDNLLYRLLRPKLRYHLDKLRPISWRGFSINWLQGKLTISKGKQRVAIWDIQKFFQQSFVATCWDWEEWEGLQEVRDMKEERGDFRVQDMPEMKEYSWSECRMLANIAKRLLTAHVNAGLTLKSYYGPGSTASTALGLMQVKDYMKDSPAAMRVPIACAFSGGRFEHSFMGFAKPVYAYDISSAYPYHAYNLPCLACGKWKLVTSNVHQALRECRTALVRYTYRGKPDDIWAPFPHRDARGTITYPWRNEGWVWLPEFREAKSFGKVRALQAWVYQTSCDCRPFAAISDYYRRRSELGKDGQGKVIKLAVNSIYGKLAQSKGRNPPYQNWIWAGLITSGTRAQVLQAIQAAPTPSDVLGIATDGIFSRVPLQLPAPRDTGTSDLPKPLGGWEEKEYPEGVMFLKPGIYLGAGTVKARGIGRKTLSEQREAIIDAYQKGIREWRVEVQRFFGAKTSIGLRGRRPRFATWGNMSITVKFACPNRRPDMGLLEARDMSHPYNPSLLTEEDIQAEMYREMKYEQP